MVGWLVGWLVGLVDPHWTDPDSPAMSLEHRKGVPVCQTCAPAEADATLMPLAPISHFMGRMFDNCLICLV